MATNSQKPNSKLTDTQILGKRLKALRIKRGHIYLKKFANKYNISRKLYYNYENGTGNITYKNLLKVTRALNISLEELFKGL